jgi:hypothetical protein
MSRYTPDWTATLAPPHLGNGSINGVYETGTENEDQPTKPSLVIWLEIGSHTQFGRGIWLFSVPHDGFLKDEYGIILFHDYNRNIKEGGNVSVRSNKIIAGYPINHMLRPGNKISISIGDIE